MMQHNQNNMLDFLDSTDPWEWDVVQNRAWTLPDHLEAYQDVHPRLFLNASRLDEIATKSSPVHIRARDIILENARVRSIQDPPSDIEREEDMRRAGRGIPWLALGYLLTGDPIFLEAAKRWLNTVCLFPHWERDNSLSGGECLFGVAVGYDWLYADLSDEERQSVEGKLLLQANAMATGPPVHHDIWLANHNHVENLGLAAAGFALFDRTQAAAGWIRQADLTFDAFLRASSLDGSSSEGHQYWAYTAESVLRYAELARDFLGRDYYDTPWLKSIAKFVIGSLLPGFNETDCVMSFGDSHRTFMSHGPTHILFRIAAEYRDSTAQWFGERMQEREIGKGSFCTWADLLWYDESVSSTPPDDLPLLHHADDIGWVTSRSSWREDATMVGFKCGPMHGHKAQGYYDGEPSHHSIGGGHGHPDVNSFQIYSNGRWLAIDPEYEKPKWTRSHCSVLVNGKGQLGAGKTWFDRDAVLRSGASSKILKVESHSEFDYVVGDAGTIYGPPLTRFHRHLVFVKPDIIVILDDLEAETSTRFDWLLHTESSLTETGPGAFLATNGPVAMDILLPLPEVGIFCVEDRTLRASYEDLQRLRIAAVLHPRRLEGPQCESRVTIASDNSVDFYIRTAVVELCVSLDPGRQLVEIARS
jgi:hypothetical protein